MITGGWLSHLDADGVVAVQGGLVTRPACAGRASYATYVLHPLVLTAIMALFASLALAPELTFLVVAAIAVPACYLVGYAATRLPGISKVL